MLEIADTPTTGLPLAVPATPTPRVLAPDLPLQGLPTPTQGFGLQAADPGGDLAPLRIEVFQVINPRYDTDDPEIPLVADKETRVRVYARLVDADSPRVAKVRLEALRGNQVLDPCLFFFTETEKSLSPTAMSADDFIKDARDELSKTFNFMVPRYCPAVDAGTTTFRATVVGTECLACAANNVTSKGVSFHAVRAPRIKPYVVTYNDPDSPHNGKAPAPDWSANFSRLFDIYPISHVGTKTWGAFSNPPTIKLDWPDTDEGKESFKENWAALHDYFIDTYGVDDVDSNMAIVHTDLVSCRGRSIGVHSIQGGGCGGTYAHELGHTIGLPHASDFHGECDGGSCQPDWPYSHGGFVGYGFDRTKPNQLIGVSGLVADGNVLSGWHSHDFMSYGGCEEYAPAYGSGTGTYCKDWISPLHYAKIAQRLSCGEIARYPDAACLTTNQPWNVLYANRTPSEWAAAPMEELNLLVQAGAPYSARYDVSAASMQERTYLHLYARLRPDGSVDLRPLYQRSVPPTPARDRLGRGSHQIELLDGDGNVLFSRGVDPSPVLIPHDEPGEGGSYLNEVLPWDARAVRVVIRSSGQVLAERAVAGGTPTVRLVSPNGSETVGAGPGMLTVRWESSDPDGDALHHWVDFSADGGRTWNGLIRNVQGSSVDIPLSELPGTDVALIRVLATDGINTGADGSDATFIVPRHAPVAQIESPTEGARLPTGSPIVLSGAAFDAEDGTLPDSALVWSSSIGGQIGVGGLLQGAQLAAGDHVITLTARDSDGQTSTASVNVTIGGGASASLVRPWSAHVPIAR